MCLWVDGLSAWCLNHPGRLKAIIIQYKKIIRKKRNRTNNKSLHGKVLFGALFIWTLCLMCPSDISFLPRPAMVWCERGIQVLLTTMGAFAAFALMTVAIGTDYWLYARAFICNSTANSSQEESNNKDKKDPGALTHSGLWRICCLEGKAGCNRLKSRLCVHVRMPWGSSVYVVFFFMH